MNRMMRLAVVLFHDIAAQKRNIFIMLAIGFGAFFIVAGGGYNAGVKRQLLELRRTFYTGDVAIVASGVDLKPSPLPLRVGFDQLLVDTSGVRERLEALDGVADVIPRLVVLGSAMGSDESESAYVTVIGTDFEREGRYGFKNLAIEGEGYDGEENVAYVSKEIAAQLHLKRGDPLYLFVASESGMPIPMKLVVGGIFVGRGFPAVVESLLYVKYGFLHRSLRFSEPRYSSLLVFVKHPGDKKTIEAVKDILPEGWKTASPSQMGAFFEGIFQAFRAFSAFSYFLQYLTVFLFIYSTLLVSINNRKKEMGVMLASGVSMEGVMALFVSEGMLMVLFPAVVSGAVAVLLVLVFSQIGIPAPTEAMKYSFGGDMLYLRLDPWALFHATVTLSLIGGLGAFLAVWRLRRLKPIELLEDHE